MKYFSSDEHLGHRGVIEMSDRPFSSIEEMNETIITNLFNIPAGSDLYIIGDLAWNQQAALEVLNRKPKNINLHFIMGNHDHKAGKTIFKDKKWTSVSELKVIHEKEYTITLCHYPMMVWYRSFVPTSFHLYGHIHKNTPMITPTGKQINVNCEFWDYKPISFDRIVEAMKKLPENWEIEEIKRRDNPFIHIYFRDGIRYEDRYASIEEAENAMKIGKEENSMWTERIIDSEGKYYYEAL